MTPCTSRGAGVDKSQRESLDFNETGKMGVLLLLLFLGMLCHAQAQVLFSSSLPCDAKVGEEKTLSQK